MSSVRYSSRIAEKGAENAPPSPNLQTRSKRREAKRPPHCSSLERQRIARLCKEFAKDDCKPCSVFGRDREERWNGFFFCGQCQAADDQETLFPDVPINRRTENGPYTCIASHDNVVFPTDTVKIESVVKRSAKGKRKVPPRHSIPSDIAVQATKKTKTAPESDGSFDESSQSSEESEMDSIFKSSGEEEEECAKNTHQVSLHSGTAGLSSESRTDSTLTRSLFDDSTMSTSFLLNDLKKENDRLRSSRQEKDVLIDNLQREVLSFKLKLKQQQQVTKRQTRKIAKFKTKLLEVQRSNTELVIPTKATDKDRGDQIVKHIKMILIRSVRGHGKDSERASRFFQSFCQMILDSNIHHGVLQDTAVQIVGQHIRRTIFTPFRILQEMDKAGGVLNYEGIEILRRVESNGKARMRTIIPSTSSLQNCAASIELYGSRICPFRMIRNETSMTEGFYFRPADVMKIILKSGGLLTGDAVDRPIHMAQSIDGAVLTKHLSHTLGGLKFNDSSNPLSQSRNSVFPVVCVCGRETTPVVRGLFGRMIQEIDEAAITVLPTAHGIKPIRISTNCDMSCDWKLSGRGGAAKNCKFPCSKCAVKSADLHLASQLPSECKLCLHMCHTENDPNWVCRHIDMCTREHTALMKEEVKKFEAECPQICKTIESIRSESKIRTDEDPRFPPDDLQETSTDSIHFDYKNATIQDRREFSRNITNDLQLRKMSLEGSLEERHERLKVQHMSEWSFVQASLRVGQFKYEGVSTALVMMMDAVPCLLHLENRMGIKILSMCLKFGLTSTKNDEQEWISDQDKNSMEKKCKAFVEKVENILNTSIIGSMMHAQHWILPFDKETNTVSKICMDNVKIRKIVAEMDQLIDPMIVDDDKKAKWKKCIDHYRQAIEIANRKHNLSNEEIWNFQRQADYFFALWIDLCGAEGVTNYAHMIGSGHLSEYMFHWKNLSRHTQQGWEAFNSAFKSYYFSRTQRGGATNQGRGQQSRMKSMARWLQRRLVFMLGIPETEILEDNKANGQSDTGDKVDDWVLKNGGTIEFGQPIGVTVRNQDDVEHDAELVFDFTVGLNNGKEQNTPNEPVPLPADFETWSDDDSI